MPKQIDLKDLNLGAEVWTPELAQSAQQQIQAALTAENLPAEKLVEIGEWAQRVIQDPGQFPEFQAWLRSQGLDEEDIPKEPDYQELSAMATIGAVAAQQAPAQPKQPAAQPTGPVSPEQMQAMAGAGRMGDTMLAHINPTEAAVLESMGGVGTINPATGLPEYGFFSDLWKGIKKVAKAVAPFVLPVMALIPGLQPLIPALGTALGASAAFAPIVGAAAIAGGVTALSGGSIKEVLSSAALTGLGAYLTPIVGKYVGGLVGVTSPGIQSAIGSATLAGGLTALRGGTVSQILTAAATGGAANYLGQVASNAINSGKITNTRITQKTFDDAVFAAADAKGLADAGLGEGQIRQILTDTGLQTQVASDAAQAAVRGLAGEDIAVMLSNKYGGATWSGSKNLYKTGTAVTNSVIGGANVDALETVQRAEDALFVAERAKMTQNALATNGVTGRAAQPAIEQDLIAMGVDPKVAQFAASQAVENVTAAGIGNGIMSSKTFTNIEFIGQPPATVPSGADLPSGGTASVSAPTVSQTTPTTATPSLSAAEQLRLDDAAFMAADAQQLAAQGLSRDQIQSTLVSSGASQNAAYNAALSASMGKDAATITRELTNQRGDLYTARPVTPEPAAPSPVAPEQPMSGEDLAFAQADAAQLEAQGLDPAAIQQNLEYSGVPPQAAQNLSVGRPAWVPPEFESRVMPSGETVYVDPNSGTMFNASANIVGNTTAPVAPAPGLGNVSDADFLAADAAQLAAQGLGQSQIVDTLVASGASPVAAVEAGITAAAGATPQEIAAAITAQTGSQPIYTAPVAPPPAAPRFQPPPNAQAANLGGARGQGWAIPAGDGTFDYYTQDGEYVRSWSPDTGDFQRGSEPLRIDITGVGDQPSAGVTDAEFIAADAAQLAAQTNNNTAAIEQNLVYAGVDPVTAATAAGLAASGATVPQITQAITNQPGFVSPEPAPAPQPVPEATNVAGGINTSRLPVAEGYELVGQTPTPPGFQPGDLGTGITEPVYPSVPGMGGGQGITVPGVTPEAPPALQPDLTPPMSDGQIGAIVATPTLPNPLEPPATPGRPDMGTFTPAPPDPSWSRALQYPGVNPGLVGAAIRPAYATTSPVQSQYYWGRQPYFAYTEDLDRYNQVAMPATPFGIQQGYFEQPLALPEIPVYGENMFIQPQAQPMARTQAFAAPEMQTAQAFYPQQLFPVAPQMVPGSANYIYDIRPTAAQYTVPGASPV